ncbi:MULTISPECIES: hypothetical protein [Bacillus]|uniref:hypothetical protein n=1 Tax=Bacillus TaxID=1386 RepID=UPI0001A18AD6|nr:hypothetical protein [Bacillus pseudomycoides]EEM13455.1 hypothetical protein bpmyx0001_57300 [Bacillus pseudomycoides DSM 12442]MED1599059.1 hypothetical protein [Bacillus pseudomycoides]MED4711935.1 hypothetical protein [Bacillus pseudomycoides]OOR47524.1 hypothetical protein BLX05_30340 [Bacillus pseudomycoides]PDY09992.1 hypothetical protein COO16_23055 [Bacillus pseudomycoides]
MKKIYILLATLTILFLCLAGIIFFNDARNEKYIIWKENVHENDYLLKKLKDNDIPYKIDERKNLKIQEKDTDKVILCCT